MALPILRGVAFDGAKFLAVGDSGVASISTNSTNWTDLPTATTNKLNAVIFGDGRFVAAGERGELETSTDGTNWILSSSATTNSLSALAYSNGRYIAAGDKAVVTSVDAMTWSAAVTGLSGAKSIAAGENGFVAVAGTPQAYISTDGLSWTSETFSAPTNVANYNYWPIENEAVTYAGGTFFVGATRHFNAPVHSHYDRYIFSSQDGLNWQTNNLGEVPALMGSVQFDFFLTGSNQVIAIGQIEGTQFLLHSTNGTSWQSTSYRPDPYPVAAAGASGNGTFVVMVTRYPISFPFTRRLILTSADGFNWTFQPPGPSGPSNDLTSITFNNGLYVATATNSVMRSSNGLAYTMASNTPALAAATAAGNLFIGVGSGGAIYVSNDALTWTQRNSGTLNNLRAVTAGGGLSVAVGDNGAIQTSPNGTIWTSRFSGTSLALYGVTFAGAQYVAVGQFGTVLNSPDGFNWTVRDSGQLTNLLAITHGAAGFLAVGAGGTILTSVNGVEWISQSSGTTNTLRSAAFGSGYYLVVGDNATALISPDGTHWTSRKIGASSAQSFCASAFLNNRFVVAGASGTVIESDVIPPLFDVRLDRPGSANIITVFITPGSDFRIFSCTDLSMADWTALVAFTNANAITQWTNSSTDDQRYYRAVSP